MNITRSEIRTILSSYFLEQNFNEDQFTERDKGTIDMMLNHIISVKDFSPQYMNLKSSKRKRLKNMVGQEVALMKKRGLCRRVTWGRYRPIS
tara:strand:- start:156 stop:431 length:276 start_codon:yes stop_codon:yes gene_type:complete